MEEDNFPVKIATREGSLGLGEGEMWTFVDTKESSNNSQEDSQDDRSEHESDGSSIVVISMESSTMEDGAESGDLEEIGSISDFICAPNQHDECLDCDATISNLETIDDNLVEERDKTPLSDPSTLQQDDNLSFYEDDQVKEICEGDNLFPCDFDSSKMEQENLASDVMPVEGLPTPEDMQETDFENTIQEIQDLSTSETNPDEPQLTVGETENLNEESKIPSLTIEEPEPILLEEPESITLEDPESITSETVILQPDSDGNMSSSLAIDETSEDTIVNDTVEDKFEHITNRKEEDTVVEQQETGEFGYESAPLELPMNIETNESATLDEENNEDMLPESASNEPIVEANPVNDFHVAEDEFENLQDDSESESESSEAEEEGTWEFNSDGQASSSLNSSVNSTPQHQPVNLPGRLYVAKPDLLEEANRIEEMDQMDYSTLTNQDLPADLNLAAISRERHYVHHPNRRLNLTLSFVVAFSMAAVIGFGLGHFIGLSDNFPPRPGCTTFPFEERRGLHDRFEGWSEADWKLELQRLQTANEELSQALENQQTMCQSQKQNELITENWDLKSTIGRIRYGKPVRSFEDRDRINLLETENQELRAQVGKLRYKCKQPTEPSSDSKPTTQGEHPKPEPRHSDEGEPWASPNPDNTNSFWNQFIVEHFGGPNMTRHLTEKLDHLKKSAANLIGVIETRWQELSNFSRQMEDNKVTLKMKQTLEKSAQKVVDIANEMFNSENKKTYGTDSTTNQKSWTDQMERIKLKLESSWKTLKSKFETHESPEAPSHFKKTKDINRKEQREENDGRSLNEDWFLLMGKQREKMRKNQHKTDWLFERAKNREQERYEKKKGAGDKFKKDKTKFKRRRDSDRAFQDNQWNYFSS